MAAHGWLAQDGSRERDPDLAGETPPGGERPGLDPRAAVSERERAAALAAGPPGIPRRFVYWTVVAVVVLGLGGVVTEHIVSAVGLNPAAPPAPVTHPAPSAPLVARAAPVSGRASAIASPLASFMGLQRLAPSAAPPIALTNQSGQPASLAGRRGSVVVLTFFDGPCNDICPVLSQEIRAADTDLGPAAARVTFLTVNTDPKETATSALRPAVDSSGLGALPNWQMLTGPLATLNPVWRAYGVSISLSVRTGLVSHNDVMDFIDPLGRLRYRATPVADETGTGSYSLDPTDVARWGHGIATYAARLAGPA